MPVDSEASDIATGMEPTLIPKWVPPRLPVDLVHDIVASIDDPDQGDEENVISPVLIACSLVCRAWNDICRPRIFSKLVLNDDMAGFINRLCFLHYTAPHLSKYILQLHLWWDGDICLAPGWVSDCLNRCKNLRSLWLVGTMDVPIHHAVSALGIMSLITTVRLEALAIVAWEVDKDGSNILPMLSACSTTLKQFSMIVRSVSDHGTTPEQMLPNSRAQSIVLMEALGTLELRVGEGVRLPHINNIACPNLESLEIQHPGNDPWGIPSYIPANLPALTLTASCSSGIPDIGPIQPSRLTLDVHKESYEPYHSVMVWVRDCLNGLRFPSHLRGLTIVIRDSEREGLYKLHYPSLADYRELYRILLSLHQQGASNVADIIIKTSISSGRRYFDDSKTEVAKLRKAVTPLLRGGKMAINLTLEQDHSQSGT